jgi:hypothetical protein
MNKERKNKKETAAEVRESVESKIAFEEPTAPAVVEPMKFENPLPASPDKVNVGPQSEAPITDDGKAEVQPANPARNSGEVGSAEEAFGEGFADRIKITPEKIEEYVSGESDVFEGFDNPIYEEIKIILIQWNFKHGTSIELNGAVLSGSKGFKHIKELRRDLRDWYPGIDVKLREDGEYELSWDEAI